MGARISWSQKAETHMNEIYEYIASDNLAQRIDFLTISLIQLSDFQNTPESGMSFPGSRAFGKLA
jgi:plasmid stabilization system protein ParE